MLFILKPMICAFYCDQRNSIGIGKALRSHKRHYLVFCSMQDQDILRMPMIIHVLNLRSLPIF